MKLLRGVRAMRGFSAGCARRGRRLGLVPTMGALHAGHLSLIRRARSECGRVVVSIFVNPLQFGPSEDYRRYPRPVARDRRLCDAAGIDALYLPSVREIYPEGFRTRVEVEGLSDLLCGEFRPGHFGGVATVVLKLLETVRPDAAYFGEKDFQQLVIVRRMARDLNLPVRIVGCPTVREADGLALSSRNAYLSPDERARAPRLHRALELGARAALRQRASPGEATRRAARELRAIPGARLDYVRLVDEKSLEPASRLRGRLRLLAAIRLGRTRLIDNVPVKCED